MASPASSSGCRRPMPKTPLPMLDKQAEVIAAVNGLTRSQRSTDGPECRGSTSGPVGIKEALFGGIRRPGEGLVCAAMPSVPDRAQVVIVGGGIVGASIAYHLTRREITDVVVLEQNTLTAGTTWHAAGLVKANSSRHSRSPKWRPTRPACSRAPRMKPARPPATARPVRSRLPIMSSAGKRSAVARRWPMGSASSAEKVSIDEAAERFPHMRTDDLVGALYPRDGQTSPVDTTMALARGAKARGATVIENVAVTQLKTKDGKIAGVVTEQGEIEAEIVVLATGMWTRHLAAQIGVNVPLQACEHLYIVTEPIEGMEIGTTTLPDPGNHTYFKEETGKIMAGFFEPRGKVWRMDEIPRDFSFGTLPEDWDHVGPIFERAIHRVPVLGEVGLQLFFNGPEAFTPDGVYYMGEAPEVDNCYVAAGFNSVGIQSAGGVGWALADWIADKHPPMDLNSVDIRRAQPFQADEAYLQDQFLREPLGLLYQRPFRQYGLRGIRLSPLHGRIDAAGAVWGETAGWERPNWYAGDGQAREYEYSYGKQSWHDNMVRECQGVREAVGLFDQTSFAKARVEGPGALAVLNHLSVANIDAPIHKAVYTQWCNHKGGIEADLTVTRTSHDTFFVVTAAAAENQGLHMVATSGERQGRHDHQHHPRHRDARADGSQRVDRSSRRSPTPASRMPTSRKVVSRSVGANRSRSPTDRCSRCA